MASRVLSSCLLAAVGSAVEWAPCAELYLGTPREARQEVPTEAEFAAALKALDVEAVKEDLNKLLTSSQPCWPADFGNYVGLFTRLSWHASGTFRKTDGAGGAGGGRQRFEPEASWVDNTNLDKARALLAPLKRKYGAGLSWADLMVLAGSQAMWHQGVPLTEFCFGRMDDADGNRSLPLGPGPLQEKVAPCTGSHPGLCQERANETALAPTMVELIYVNPEGPVGKPEDTAGSAKEIRTVFEKMGHTARSTVALIGGGHAFGKTHGACSDKEVQNPAGLAPDEARAANTFPYMGACPAVGDTAPGIGLSTWTSGFEGPWTLTPTKWSNEFFQMLLDHEWEMWTGPGGHKQWRLKAQPNDPRMRLTADMALIADPEYKQWVQVFARNLTALNEAFDQAWHELITNGEGWAAQRRCVPFSPPPKDPTTTPMMLGTDAPVTEAPGEVSLAARSATLVALVASLSALLV